jgi:hypothetical protein
MHAQPCLLVCHLKPLFTWAHNNESCVTCAGWDAHQVLQDLEQHANGNWKLTPAGNLVTATRESGTLSRLKDIPLLDYILDPSKYCQQQQQQQQGNGGSGLKMHLDPDGPAVDPDGQAAGAAATAAADGKQGGQEAAGAAQLPLEVSSSGFWSYLQGSFDPPQIRAITASAAHLAQAQQRRSSGGGDQGGRLVKGEEDEGTGTAAGDRWLTDAPFTLIQVG